jgi:hypothetical protein
VLGYDLGLISNVTFFLDDPVRGDQREQVDHRFVSGARAFQKRQTRWGGRPVENTIGVQFRNDDVMQNALTTLNHESASRPGTMRQRL